MNSSDDKKQNKPSSLVVTQSSEVSVKRPLLDAETEIKIIELALDPYNTTKRIREKLGITRHAFDTQLERSPRFAAAMLRARSESMEELADGLLSIPDEEPDINRARLKSDNVKWLLSKRKPATYGDKLEVNVQQTIDISAALQAARARASLPLQRHNDAIDAEVLGSTTDTSSVDDIFS